jgi:hypothetical protein
VGDKVACVWSHAVLCFVVQINFMLMLGCVAMVAGFQDTTALGHAYGVAVMSVMFITSILAGIVMLVCYSINPLLVALFLLFFGTQLWPSVSCCGWHWGSKAAAACPSTLSCSLITARRDLAVAAAAAAAGQPVKQQQLPHACTPLYEP